VIVAGVPGNLAMRPGRPDDACVNASEEIRLIVRGDDFGMCHAVNQGIAAAFRDGIVTTSTAMAPCPWFGEAAEIAKDLRIPLGVHQTLTCEWDYFRWRPVTSGVSLTAADGTFFPSVELAQQHVQFDDAVRELLAQVGLFRSAGLSPDYLDCHMGSTLPAAYAEVSAQAGVPFLYSDEISGRLASYSELSPRDAGGKKEWLAGYLHGLGPGVHVLVSHPAVPSSELESLTGPDSVPYRWAAEYRLSDLEVLTDPDVSALIDQLGIRLCSLPEALAGLVGPPESGD
jgi:chitin disaccharide deacetylase